MLEIEQQRCWRQGLPTIWGGNVLRTRHRWRSFWRQVQTRGGEDGRVKGDGLSRLLSLSSQPSIQIHTDKTHETHERNEGTKAANQPRKNNASLSGVGFKLSHQKRAIGRYESEHCPIEMCCLARIFTTFAELYEICCWCGPCRDDVSSCEDAMNFFRSPGQTFMFILSGWASGSPIDRLVILVLTSSREE